MVDSIGEVERTTVPRRAPALFDAWANSKDRCVFFKDTTGRYVQVNTAFCQWFGRPDTSVVGRTAFDLWPPAFAEALTAADRRALAGEFVEKEELCPNAHELRTLRIRVMPVKDARGRIVGILGFFADVTEERHPDVSQQPTRRRAVTRRLRSGLKKERNELLRFLRRREFSPAPEDLLPGELAEAMSAIAKQSAALARRVTVLDREDQEAAAAGDLNLAVEEVTQLFREALAPSVHLKVFAGHDLPLVYVSQCQLAQVVLNLCLNAREAMPEGGRLTVETDLVRFGATVSEGTGAAVSRECGPRHVRLRVSDTGRASGHESRFRDFAGAIGNQALGRGVGLSVIQDVVRGAGGWVECGGEPGRGSSFSVFLPAIEDSKALSTASALAPLPNSTVLLADNDPCIIALCQTILRTNGYRVRTAGGGKEAAEVYRRERGEIGVVVLDQNMPGMSGLEVLTELVATDPGVRVLFMSGAPLEDVPPALARNLRGFLNKPFRAVELIGAVRSALVAE